MPRRRRVAYDTEFIEHQVKHHSDDCMPVDTVDLVSIGMVNADEPTEHLYLISSEFDRQAFIDSKWLIEHVLPHIPYEMRYTLNGRPIGLLPDKAHPAYPRLRTRAQIRDEVYQFITGGQPDRQVELWADYGAYDHVALCWLFGRMSDLPLGVPMFTHDVQAYASLLPNVEQGEMPGRDEADKTLHDALADAADVVVKLRWLDGRFGDLAARDLYPRDLHPR